MTVCGADSLVGETKKPRLEAEAARVERGFAPARRVTGNLLRLNSLGLDHHKLPHRSLVEELDASRDLGEESVVFAASDVQSGLHPCAALANDDRAAWHQLPAESLKAKPLRVRAAPVSCSALSFFMCHKISSRFSVASCPEFPNPKFPLRR